MGENILITGITGMLGKAVYRYFKEFGNYNLFGISRQSNYNISGVQMFYGDLSSVDFLKTMSHIAFNTIIHCSAEVNVNLCETDKDSAYKSNVISTKNIFSLLKSQKYIYISTDAVFDGQIGNYSESSNVKPLNYYAETKLLGENSVKEIVDNYYILRTNIYGFNIPMKSSLFEWGYSELNNDKSVNGFSNMFFNPMYVGQLASLIERIVTDEVRFGTYNVGASDKISKYDFLAKIASDFNFTSNAVVPVEFDQKKFVAKRALNTTLDVSKIQSVFKDFDFSINTGFSMLKKDLKNG
jgi:dTDP-4-dehydrorhamnose reductase